MKTQILALAMTALMMGITFNSSAANEDTTRLANAAANKELNACINLCQDNIVKFLIENPGQDKLKLRIYDENGQVLYTYILKKENVARIGFDISGLDAGNYDCVIEKNKKEMMRKTIVKKDNTK